MPVASQFPWNPAQPCRIAFVAEAPSDEEVIEGLPLVGSSGRVMSQMLRTAGLAKSLEAFPIPRKFYPTKRMHGLRPMLWERSDFFWTNVFDNKLPDNDIKNWCSPATERITWDGYDLPRIEGSGYLRPQYQNHLVRLQSELQAVQPTLVVPLGGTALWAFTGRNDITSARGACSTASFIVPGCKLLPTYHPANVIHSNWKPFSIVVSDLIKAWRESAFPELRLSQRELWIEPTLEDLHEFSRKFIYGASGPCAIDIETAAGQITCIGFAPDISHALVIPFIDYRKSDRSYWSTAQDEIKAWDFIRKICADPMIPKLLQNGSYDSYWLLKKYGIKMINYAHDTRLQHHALFQELPKSLAFMGATYANEGAWKQMRERRSDKRDE